MLIHICQDEYQLFFQFFTKQTNSLKYLKNENIFSQIIPYFYFNFSEFLDKNCRKLYDTLRPVVIHLEHLESLSEICYILKNELIDENILNQSLYQNNR